MLAGGRAKGGACGFRLLQSSVPILSKEQHRPTWALQRFYLAHLCTRTCRMLGRDQSSRRTSHSSSDALHRLLPLVWLRRVVAACLLVVVRTVVSVDSHLEENSIDIIDRQAPIYSNYNTNSTSIVARGSSITRAMAIAIGSSRSFGASTIAQVGVSNAAVAAQPQAEQS